MASTHPATAMSTTPTLTRTLMLTNVRIVLAGVAATQSAGPSDEEQILPFFVLVISFFRRTAQWSIGIQIKID
jgi:hypothetical protein